MRDYKGIFESVESTLVSVGSQNAPIDSIRENLDWYKHFEGKAFSDIDYFRKLIDVVFYSGFKASTVTSKLESIHKHFPDCQTVATYGEDKVAEILSDYSMIRNTRKIQACIYNAQTFQNIIREYGSFHNYIESFHPADSFENLMLLKEEFEYRFRGLGKITTHHFLTDIGMPVIKPDRVICRIFRRLGLIESDEQLLKTVIQGRKFAMATGHPIRYIDVVFVAYGQVDSRWCGLRRGICTENNPSCSICGVRDLCIYFSSKNQNRI